MTDHHFHDSDINLFFLKQKKLRNKTIFILDTKNIDTRVAKCIKAESQNIKKRHPEWSGEMIHKKAQTICGQKSSVQIKDKKNPCNSGDSLEECASQKIPIIKKEHPEWEQKQVAAVAYNYCREAEKEDGYPYEASESILDTYRLSHDLVPEGMGFIEYAGVIGYHSALEDTSICYKMENLEETDDEYIVPVVLAKAMTQPYPSKGLIMAKRPEDLEKALAVDYVTAKIIDKIPTFEFHPEEEKRENENGYVSDVHYQSDHERIVGNLHVLKKKLSDNLRDYFERGEQIHVSIGFMYMEGPGGTFFAHSDDRWNGEEYDAAQQNILITHLALLPPNKSRGRCPLPYCGVGIKVNDSISLESVTLKSIIDNNISSDAFRENNDLTQLKDKLRKHFILIANALR